MGVVDGVVALGSDPSEDVEFAAAIGDTDVAAKLTPAVTAAELCCAAVIDVVRSLSRLDDEARVSRAAVEELWGAAAAVVPLGPIVTAPPLGPEALDMAGERLEAVKLFDELPTS